ncbi:MAG TPA: hypothetical protein VG347_05435 [Verrucomicrobiae bacterium]|nr:hypothetical protein [Verrucomicrobiae bacterium]
MKQTTRLLRVPGEAIRRNELTVAKAKQFAAYLRGSGNFATVGGFRRIQDPLAEVVPLVVTVQRPQHPAHDIRRVEPVAVVFYEDDNRAPEVLCLRPDSRQFRTST